MTNRPGGGIPAKIDRDALERIIRRATELQTAERDIGEGLSEEEVLALGSDVGIPARYLRQAILENRSDPTTDGGPLGRLIGAPSVSAQRVIAGERDGIEATLLRWMEQHELLVLQRQIPGRITWEPLRGVQAAFRRGAAALERGRAKFMLAKSDLVTATVTPLESGYWHVHLESVLRKARGEVIGGGAALMTLGGAGTIVLVTLSAVPVVAALPLPAAAVATWFALRSYGPVRDRVQLGLERILDHLQQEGCVRPAVPPPEPRPGVFDHLAEEVRRAIRSGRSRRRDR